jgi:four helix bundle protein
MTSPCSHRDLLVWRKSVALASKVYSATGGLPPHERDALQAEMRKSALSVASHIAEGAARSKRADYLRHLDIARSSLTELETQVVITSQLQLIDSAWRLDEEIAELRRLLTALIQRLPEQPSRC